MTIRPLGATFAAAALLLLAGCKEETAGTAAPQSSPAPTSAAASTAPPPSASAPPISSSPATSSATTTKAATGKPAAHTPDGAGGVFEEYLHAVAAKNLEVACRISGPAFDGGMKECRQNTTMLFGMLSEDDIKKLSVSKVNRSMLQSKGPDKVVIPAAAYGPKSSIMEGDDTPTNLEWRDGTWVIVG